MKTRLSIAFIGNLIDTAATIILYHRYGFTEANPLMALLLQFPVLFATVKLVVMSAVLLWLWRNRNSRYARYAALVAALVYGVIAIYYAVFFGILL